MSASESRRRVEHPRLEHGAAARGLAHAQHARLLGVVGQRRGLHQPVAARRRVAGDDAVAVRVAGQRRDDVRVARRAGRAPPGRPSTLVSGWWETTITRRSPAAASWPRSHATCSAREDAARADVAAHGVERDHAHGAADVEGVVHARAAAAVAAGGAQARDSLVRGQLAPRRRRARRARCVPGSPPLRALSTSCGVSAFSLRGTSSAGVGRDQALVADGDGLGRRRARRARRPRAGRGCRAPGTTARAARPRGTAAARRRAARGGAAGRRRGGSRRGRGRRPPARPDSRRAPGVGVGAAAVEDARAPARARWPARCRPGRRVTRTASGRAALTERTAASSTWAESASCGRKVEENGPPRRSRNGTRAGDSSSRTWASVRTARVASVRPGRGGAREVACGRAAARRARAAGTPSPSGSRQVARSVEPSGSGGAASRAAAAGERRARASASEATARASLLPQPCDAAARRSRGARPTPPPRAPSSASPPSGERRLARPRSAAPGRRSPRPGAPTSGASTSRSSARARTAAGSATASAAPASTAPTVDALGAGGAQQRERRRGARGPRGRAPARARRGRRARRRWPRRAAARPACRGRRRCASSRPPTARGRAPSARQPPRDRARGRRRERA